MIPRQRQKRRIEITNESVVFFFNSARYGYDLEDYYPSITEHNFRMRDLIFFFSKLHFHLKAFQSMKNIKKQAWIRKKAILSFVFFLMFFLPALFATQLVLSGKLNNAGTTVILIIFFTSVALTIEFLIIDHNNSKMDGRLMKLQLAREIKG